MCLAGTVVASWSLTQRGGREARLSPFTVMTNIFFTEFSKFILKTLLPENWFRRRLVSLPFLVMRNTLMKVIWSTGRPPSKYQVEMSSRTYATMQQQRQGQIVQMTV